MDTSGNIPQGVFTGTISDAAPQTRIADDGKTIVPIEDDDNRE